MISCRINNCQSLGWFNLMSDFSLRRKLILTHFNNLIKFYHFIIKLIIVSIVNISNKMPQKENTNVHCYKSIIDYQPRQWKFNLRKSFERKTPVGSWWWSLNLTTNGSLFSTNGVNAFRQTCSLFLETGTKFPAISTYNGRPSKT